MPTPEDEWKKKLTPEQYRVMREKDTEPPFSDEYVHKKETGKYVCAACGNDLFNSNNKFDSGSGWPSFDDVIRAGTVKLKKDNSNGMKRTEVICAKCESHLGHVFEDGPKKTTGKRYCINSASLNFKKG